MTAQSFTPAFPWIAALTTICLGLLAVLLALRVIVNRVRLGIEIGDGGVPKMAQSVRAHANFTEHAPMALILLAMSEAAGAAAWLVLTIATLLVTGRILSAIGLSHSLGPSFARQAGASATLLAMVIASVGLVWTVVPWIWRSVP